MSLEKSKNENLDVTPVAFIIVGSITFVSFLIFVLAFIFARKKYKFIYDKLNLRYHISLACNINLPILVILQFLRPLVHLSILLRH